MAEEFMYYITKIEGRKNKYINYLKFTTNLGNSVEAGGPGGESFNLTDIRLIGLD